MTAMYSSRLPGIFPIIESFVFGPTCSVMALVALRCSSLWIPLMAFAYQCIFQRLGARPLFDDVRGSQRGVLHRQHAVIGLECAQRTVEFGVRLITEDNVPAVLSKEL